MKKTWIILFTVIIIITAIVAVFLYKKTAVVCFGNNCFAVKIANNPTTRELGLMFRKSLDENQGMLFIFPKEETYSFWMKNTSIPLDIIWINQNKKVVFISKNNQPCKINPCPLINQSIPAKYVLEINGGLSDKINLKVSDKIEPKTALRRFLFT
ncbi:DUF192 domain-containing protein [Patescibacteria group bacterium]|nr:DUF192 domain-containing protein [Patescibacteria group bacterium]